MDNRINEFMYIYMYNLEQFLLSRKNTLDTISFQSDEANTDRPLTEYLKNLIEKEFNKIPLDSNVKYLNIENKLDSSLSDLDKINISKVLLPEEITSDIKNTIREYKSAVYTNPDMCFVINDGNSVFYETIELKSTKQDSIPGSSIQQILPNEWVIFIKHTPTSIDVVTGKYINSINSKMQFPDRSPRPQVSFKELKNWNKTHRTLTKNTLSYLIDEESNEKFELISDWQKVLSDRWIEMLFESNKVKRNEPWFNNNMRKFIISFLNKYESLSSDEQIAFKTKIYNLIQN